VQCCPCSKEELIEADEGEDNGNNDDVPVAPGLPLLFPVPPVPVVAVSVVPAAPIVPHAPGSFYGTTPVPRLPAPRVATPVYPAQPQHDFHTVPNLPAERGNHSQCVLPALFSSSSVQCQGPPCILKGSDKLQRKQMEKTKNDISKGQQHLAFGNIASSQKQSLLLVLVFVFCF